MGGAVASGRRRAAPVEGATKAGGSRRLRADARRNRDRLLLAARDVFVERGTGAPLDEIARRAGVGIGTLYRRFPARQALLRAVALDVWRQVADEARRALAEEPDAFKALTRYMHRALEHRVAAIMPALAGEVALDDQEARRLAGESTEALQRIIDAAQAEGTLRQDVAFGDIGLLLIRFRRPLPRPLPRAVEESLAHRHIELVLDGLRAGRDRPPTALPGPAMSVYDLRAAAAEAGGAVDGPRP
jgi:AcrR family transcriptional regulator